MSFVLNNSLLSISHDIYGNIFVKYLNKIYWLYVERNEKINIEPIEMKYIVIDGGAVDYRQIRHLDDKNKKTLKNAVKKSISCDDEDGEGDDDEKCKSDSDCDDEMMEYRNNKKMYGEDYNNYYFEKKKGESDDDSVCSYNSSNEYDNIVFSFSKFGDIPISCINSIFSTVSLYDFFFLTSLDNTKKTIFTSEASVKSAYRITLSNDNTLMLNIVGSGQKYFTFILNTSNDELYINNKE